MPYNSWCTVRVVTAIFDCSNLSYNMQLGLWCTVILLIMPPLCSISRSLVIWHIDTNSDVHVCKYCHAHRSDVLSPQDDGGYSLRGGPVDALIAYAASPLNIAGTYSSLEQ